MMISYAGKLLSLTRTVGAGVPYLKNIMPTTGVKVVDENGYIGGNFLNPYYPNTNYYNNFAVVVPNSDYSILGLGQVTFVDTNATIGGTVYTTVTIGGVTWMAENLDYKFSGLYIGSTSSSSSDPYGNYPNNDEATYGRSGLKYGLLYNWPAVKMLVDNQSDLIPGWHVPDESECNTLITNVGGSSIAGKRLKATTGWGTPGTDDYGFSALPAGQKTSSFSQLGSSAYFYTKTPYSSGHRFLSFSNNDSSFVSWDENYYQFSVRLVKDSA